MARPIAATAELPESTGVLTRVRVHYPAAGRELHLRGSPPLSWEQDAPSLYTAEDTFSIDFIATEGERVEVKPVLLDNGTQWSKGPNYSVRAGDTVDLYPHFFAERGRVELLFSQFVSRSSLAPRNVWAYYPPSYDENTTAVFPVLYMNDGQDLFDPSHAGGSWFVQDALDQGARDGSIREIVVIAPEATGDRFWEYTPTFDSEEGFGGGGDAYLSFVTDELMPQVHRFVRGSHSRADTGMMGSSLGGLISAYAGAMRSEVFGLVGALSPSSFWDNEMLMKLVSKSAPWPNRADRVYIDSGNAGQLDDDVGYTTRVANAYLKAGYVSEFDFRHVIQDGGEHMQQYWAERFPGAVQFLYGRGR